MLIRLLPAPHQPTVLFKLSFENIPDHLVYPLSWSNQLAALSCDDLEVPELMHAFDKAVGAQSILEEVTFDLVQNKVKCVFVDGEMEEWAFGTGLGQSRGPADSFHVHTEDEGFQMDKLDVIRRLESVLADVNESAAEMDREKKREEEREKEMLRHQKQEEERELAQQRQEEEASTALAQTPGSTGKKKHKKSKSLLMNLVSSLFPLSLNSPNSPTSPRSPLSLPASRSSSRSPSCSRSPSRAPSVRSTRSEKCKSPMGSSSAPATLSRASSISALYQAASDKKWRKPRRRGRGRALSISSIDSPLPTAAEGDENVIQHTPEASEASSASADVSAKSREPSGEDAQQERDPRNLPVIVIAPPPPPQLTPRGLRRRARSTLVDTFRMYVIPEITRRIRCGAFFSVTVPVSPSISMIPTPALTPSASTPTTATYPSPQNLTVPTSTNLSVSTSIPSSSSSGPSSPLSASIPTIPLYHPNNIGGDSILYYVWVVGSMMKRVEARLGEVVREAREEMERLEMGGIPLGLNMGAFSSCSSLNSLYHSAMSTPAGTLTSAHSAGGAIYHEGIVGAASGPSSPFGDDSQHSSSESSSKESLTMGSGSAGSTESSQTSHDGDESDTDTDGSSLHTPTGTVFHDPFIAVSSPSSPSTPGQISPFSTEDSALPSEVYNPPNSKEPVSEVSQMSKSPNASSTMVAPSPSRSSITHLSWENPSQETATHVPPPIPAPPLSPQLTSLLSQHTQLVTLHTHLHHLLILAHARVASASAEAGQREVMLEVRGRRRAWLNRSYPGLQSRLQATVVGAHPTNSNSNAAILSRAGIAMATTSQNSPLGRYSWSSDEWDCDPFAYLEPPQVRYGRRPGSLGLEKDSMSPGPSSPLSSGPTSPFLECYPNPFENEGEDAGMSYGHRKKRSASETTLFPVSEEEDEAVSDGEGSELDPNVHRRVKMNFGVSLYRHVEIDVDESSDEEEQGAGEDEDELDVDALVDVELDVPEDKDDMFDQDLPHPSHSRRLSDILASEDSEGEDRTEGLPQSSAKSVRSSLLLGHDFTLAMDVMDIDVADNIDAVDAVPSLSKDRLLGRKKIALMAAAKANMKGMGLKSQNEVTTVTT
ncbi:hypothetical protein VKT23_008722 [Stygiomarasmius scandens]|uniref:Uncharacterized protein n=1 Tax=Marasmiellus scandens TaxID=2682957 RepID=A0ABR1JFG0_9AGAR